jgi:hypothetical protein
MNKREVVWLIVRLIGLYLCYLAIISVFSLAGAFWALAGMPGTKGAEPETVINAPEQPAGIPGISPNPPARTPNRPPTVADSAADEAKRAAFKIILWYLFLTLLEGGTGFYLLFRGRLLFALLVREDKPGEIKEREPESILLNLSD